MMVLETLNILDKVLNFLKIDMHMKLVFMEDIGQEHKEM